ncbi:urease subunit alpha [Kineosporia sp. A_224]|uniref:urease subunit alpha n=1 Tax=Kineosporia sp. A_224 TaxID=1962180 RepID=UPI000B4AC030|nr:urease subunit alpha [Kineosporia sp. A_224]
MTHFDAHARAGAYGPGLDDRVVLGDTGLVVRVERDDRGRHADEVLFGFGKTGRDGIGLQAVRTARSCDLLVSNVLLLDPVLGIRATNIGIREGRVVGIGKAGNPDTMDDVDIVVGSGTAVVSGEGLIATPGGVDTHVHLLSPRVCEAELASGVTTIIGQEIGPFWGVGVGSAWVLRTGYAAFDDYPVNVGILGRGSSSRRDPLLEALEAGVCGFKVHEDTGAHLRTLDTALTVAEDYDVQVAVHTDGLNEGLTVDDTLAVLDGRAIHAYHVEGCGGGHTPDVLSLAGVPHVLASSTNPTLPYGRDAVAEHHAMIAHVHGLRADLPGDAALTHDRVRAVTMGAENLLHDLGVIPVTSSDAQGMGRAGENWRSTFGLAGALTSLQRRTGAAPDLTDDNARVLRYLAKLTINPARVHGLDQYVGSLEPGKIADIVLWRPSMFGAKPEMVLKSGFPAWGVTGDPNAAIDGAQPLVLGAQFGGHGATAAELSLLFVNGAAAAAGAVPIPTRRQVVPVTGCRTVSLGSMAHHGITGPVKVDPATGVTTFRGAQLHMPPIERAPLQQLYHL